MSNAAKFLDKMLNQFSNDLHTCMICRIEKFDSVKMKADVKPLSKVEYGGSLQELPLIVEVPVSFIKAGNFFIRPPYQKGDLVCVAFVEHDIDNIMLTGKEEVSNSSRRHSFDDAIVIGGIMPYIQSLPSDNANDLLIAKSDMTSKIVLKDSGDIIIESNRNIYIGSENASEGVPLGIQLKDWLDNHKHIANNPSDPSLTNIPETPSPSPSQKVKVI